VVATLAALAALGRDAFVALPDVKPITAMTLVVGYALGPLPGFSVGALGMLASNVMLGQGPYTPWQMAAWGLVGLAGAALARLSSRSLGRVALAVACGLSALAAKEVMNVYTWTVGASHTPAALLAAAGAGLPFDVTDALASVLFGLAFGPELARLLTRVQVRMHVTWEDAEASTPARAGAGSLVATFALALAVGLGGASGARAAPRAAGSRSLSEVSYLVGAQNSDGGFGAAPGQASAQLYTAWAAMGLAASGREPLGVRRGGRSPLDYMRSHVGALSGVGDVERTILAVHACGASAYSFAGYNLIAELLRGREGNGSFGGQVNLTAFAVFALVAAGHSRHYNPIRSATGWLERQQNADGGFGFAARGTGSDVDDTAAVLQALFDAGARNKRTLSAASGFLLRAQNPDGGFPQRPGGPSNAQSSAWAAQGLLATGRDPGLVRRRGSRSPIGYLETLVASDGSVRYSRTSAQTPVWVTGQALIALARRIFPV
ncbi:MAG TPA: prenyltransferase/squalene oxidase repeat-containing protein, partial [Solirubrobacteraceae bacterium]|nr:prenyltransferase/squalene oxidase repeat-containing protein [Solirubrobacteraceae bacterium]